VAADGCFESNASIRSGGVSRKLGSEIGMAMPPLLTKKIPSKTRRGWAVKAILHAIFTGEFKGGDRLVEEELAMTIGVSRTPVREALGELAGVGVIDLKPNHGAVVRPFGPNQIRELYHVRKVLEAEAARLAADRIDPAALGEIRERHEELLRHQSRSPAWSADAMVLDEQFHELVSVSSGSQRLAEEIGRYRALVQSIREAVGNTERRQDVALLEHIKVIDELLSRQGERAAAAMDEHIVRGTEAAVTALFSNAHRRVAGVKTPGGLGDRHSDTDGRSRTPRTHPRRST